MKKRLVPLLIFGVVAIILYFLIDDFVQQMLIKPILHVAWVIIFVLESLPQALYWLAFIIIAILIARKSFARSKTIRSSGQPPTAVHSGPVATWSGLLERADTQDFSRWRLAQALRALTRDVLFPIEDINTLYLEASNDRQEMDLPPEIDAFFRAPVPRYQRFHWLRFRHRGTRAAHGLDLDPEHVVQYLEDELDPLRGE